MTDQPRPRTGGPAALGDGAAHGIVLRLTDPARIRAARTNTERAAASAAARRTGSFWLQHAEIPSTARRADRMRQREVRRPLHDADPGLRTVLTCYPDGVADLVVVARRGVLDHAGLRALLHGLTAPDRDVSALVTALRERTARGAAGRPPAPAPSWGLVEDAFPEIQEPPELVEPEHPADKAEFAPEVAVAAAAVALSRYERSATVRLAVIVTEPAGRAPGAKVIPVDAGDEQPLSTLVAQVRTALRSPAEESADALPPVCLVLTGHTPDAEYVPLAPQAVPLTLTWHGDEGAVLAAGHTHDPAAVHPVVARDFARHTRHLAAQLADAAPGRTVGDLALLDGPEADAVLALGRTTRTGPPGAATLHDAVARFAREQPDALAVCDATRRLTYRELDARAADWARVLVDRGAGPGRFVGVCLKRTTDLVVALLAVLKTGAAYVPLDPQAPDERLRHIAEDAGLALVVTTLSGFPAAEGTGVLRPAALTAAAPESAGTALPSAGPDDPAYVIYTSGTTGRPKGVVVAHRNVLALLDATAHDLDLGTGDVWTFFHSAAFDFSVWEIWGCLLTGGRLVVVPHLVTRTPEDFHALVLREGVTVLSQTPSAFAGFLEMDARTAAAPAPRLIVFGGEAFDPRMVGTWFSRHPDSACRLVNMYGITETTVHVTARDVRSWDGHERPRCVGRPLPGWSVSVRDDRGRPLPPGAVGEIWVGGAGLALRYLNRPELTAERFADDRFSGERLYRSGDLGRLRLDGALDHVGRLDEQVKIRGFRIELGEVRSVLVGDPGVVDAAVVVEGQEAGPAHARLVAYTVLAEGTATADVRRRSAAILPDYMVPAEFVALAVLPLTLNGKLDRAALPATRRPLTAPPGGGQGRPVDGTDPAAAMLAVWRSVIAADLGPDDHFFTAGGNSLLAVRLLEALRRQGFGTVSMRDLYRHPTPAALAAVTGAPLAPPVA
ncbi:amino acid adenylation domain-containing protein [Streptomyces caniferus]|uniref:amino acid adenylation domain-containing protein n=1 Tax=Streptomyces caniferus TaxID=285557 RepID=UPI002E2E632A|nr:amino acid adenylation domain-containing protein [Streptomyces caniferus]